MFPSNDPNPPPQSTERPISKLEAFSKLCLWAGTGGCALAALIPLSVVALLVVWFPVSTFRSGDAHRPTTDETRALESVSASPAEQDDSASTTVSISSFHVGEKRTLRKGSWMFVDEQAANEFLAAANDPAKLSDLQRSGRVNHTSRDYTVFVTATEGLAGFVQVRTRSRNDYSRLLFWTLPQNVEPFAPPKDFLEQRADLPKSTFLYRSLEQIHAYRKADEEDNDKEVMRIGKQLEADRLLQKTRVKVLERADDPYFYKVQATLPNGSRVNGWARARDLELVPEDAKQPDDGKIRQFQEFRLGDYTYEIKQCELRARLGSEYLGSKPGAGAVFLVVRFTIANETKKTATVLSDDFTLRDAQGREFQPASNALTALMMEGENKDFFLTEIQPGVEKESVTAFEIPKTALSGTLALIVPEKGFAGSKSVEVFIKPQKR